MQAKKINRKVKGENETRAVNIRIKAKKQENMLIFNDTQ